MLSRDELRELFEYDEYGNLYWKKDIFASNGRLVKVKGSRVRTYAEVRDGYLTFSTKYISGKKTAYKVHRIIATLHYGEKGDNYECDHIDGNVTNNSPSNLQWVRHSDNMKNKSMYKNNSSGTTGVRKRRYGYAARWYDENGVLREKSFTISKYGENEAYKLARQYREDMILMNGYTERHGKQMEDN